MRSVRLTSVSTDPFFYFVEYNRTTFSVTKNLTLLTPTLHHFNDDNGVFAVGYLQSDQRSLFRVETSVWFARDILNFLRQFSFNRSVIFIITR